MRIGGLEPATPERATLLPDQMLCIHKETWLMHCFHKLSWSVLDSAGYLGGLFRRLVTRSHCELTQFLRTMFGLPGVPCSRIDSIASHKCIVIVSLICLVICDSQYIRY